MPGNQQLVPDVVVVGAGSAGCVVAAQLSTSPSCEVVVLEAGPDVRDADEPPGITGPSFFDALAEPDRIWPDLTAERRPGISGRYLRGKGTGGSSTVNAMIAVRPPPEDLDRWAHRYGAEGFGAADLEPVLARLRVPLSTVEPGLLGQALAAAAGKGWHVERARLTRWPDGRRASASSVYLEPSRSRPNLTVRGGALVDRVLLEGRRAVGVRLAGGEELAARHVVIAAGAIHSPAILLRSGIDRRGVGRNLSEHPSCSVGLELRQPVDVHGVAASVHATRGDLQVLALDHVGPRAPGWGALALAHLRPRSRGSVTLASDDPSLDPVVRLGLLDHPDDVADLVEGVGWLRDVLAHPAIAAVCSGCYLDDRGTSFEELGDDPEAIAGWLATSTGDYVHAAGTCRMGRLDDPDAVVDPHGSVIGYEGLSVCDASVFPELPGANPYLTVLTVAAHLAARINARR